MALRNFKPNPAWFKAMAIGPEIRAVLQEVAEKGEGIAEGLSQDFRITGEYADSFEVSTETILDFGGKYPGPRAAARLENTAPYAMDVEYGHGERHDAAPEDGHRVLGKTLDMLGKL